MPNKSKKITLEDLALMTKRGFDEVGSRFDKVDGRFDKVEDRLGKVEGRLDKVEDNLNNLEATLKNQYPTKDYLTDKLGDLAADIGRRIEKKKDEDKKFKEKVLEILKRNSLAEKDEILFLEKLISN